MASGRNALQKLIAPLRCMNDARCWAADREHRRQFPEHGCVRPLRPERYRTRPLGLGDVKGEEKLRPKTRLAAHNTTLASGMSHSESASDIC